MVASFIGTWKLSYCKLFDINGIEQFDPFHDASGMISYDNKGMMAVQMMRSGHKNIIKENIFEAPAESFKQAFENYIAYFGSYVIDETNKIVTHFVEGSLWPNMVGIAVSRRFEFKNDDVVTLSTLKPEALANENLIMRYLTWSRVK